MSHPISLSKSELISVLSKLRDKIIFDDITFKEDLFVMPFSNEWHDINCKCNNIRFMHDYVNDLKSIAANEARELSVVDIEKIGVVLIEISELMYKD